MWQNSGVGSDVYTVPVLYCDCGESDLNLIDAEICVGVLITCGMVEKKQK